ncbi:hypothetical protein PR202_ga16930 [Eleusine coracana subsp. coracana]|uniref:Uncharacterized protein n=1 Tax=Eleusine coracana subsp. coracana TaxID=191504 RepID=A0AAV5CP46_ELECO|nr:hypothetical protein PR202_ga16930 [Eleusine coracana subsp. coracana]
MNDPEIMAKNLQSLSPWFKQITISIKTLLDVSTMTVADLMGRLKEAEEAFKEAPVSLQHEGKLYLREEETRGRVRQRREQRLDASRRWWRQLRAWWSTKWAGIFKPAHQR